MIKCPFFDRYNINPILPNFDFDPVIYYREEKPYVIMLSYDLKSHPFLENLFGWFTTVREEFKPVDEDIVLSPDNKYYLKNFTDIETYLYVVIQVNGEGDIIIRDRSIVDDFFFREEKSTPEQKNRTKIHKGPTINDPRDDEFYEGLEPDDFEYSYPYVFEVDVKAAYVDSLYKTTIRGTYAIPLSILLIASMQKGMCPRYLPVLGNVVKLIQFDESSEMAVVEINVHEGENHYAFWINNSFDFNLDYINDENQRVQGTMSIRFIKRELDFSGDVGPIIVEQKIFNSDRETCLLNKTTKIRDIFDLDEFDDTTFMIGLIDKNKDYFLMNVFEDDVTIEYYLPVHKGKPRVIEKGYLNDKGEHILERIKVVFE